MLFFLSLHLNLQNGNCQELPNSRLENLLSVPESKTLFYWMFLSILEWTILNCFTEPFSQENSTYREWRHTLLAPQCRRTNPAFLALRPDVPGPPHSGLLPFSWVPFHSHSDMSPLLPALQFGDVLFRPVMHFLLVLSKCYPNPCTSYSSL